VRSIQLSVVGSCFLVAPLLAVASPAPEGTPAPEPSPILGGDVVEPCGFPTAVSMGGSCTGTLVHPRLVVYAAHCGDQVPWIHFGDVIEDPGGFQVVPELCMTHPIGTYGFGTDAAFCRLAEPVEGIPIAPPLMGCEADAALAVGQPVTVVGYGQSDDEEEPYGVKRYLDTEITALSWDEVFIGGTDEGVCYGDSGGPTYAHAADGSWRSFGITSWGQPGCGFGGYLSTIPHNIEWIETASEIDITPCHDGAGQWDPSPACTGFDVQLHATGGSWGVGCDFGELSGWVDTCGAAFDPDLVDAIPPELVITEPASYSRFDPLEGAETVSLPVSIEALDPGGWGVGEIELVIERDGVEQARLPDPVKPFGFDLVFPPGQWTLRAEGIDRAGNAGQSEPVVFGVGVDPPPPPPEPEPEPADDTAGSGDDGLPAGTGTTGIDDDETDSDFGGIPLADDGGCSCTTSRGGGPGGGGPLPAWLMGLGLLGLARRRRARLGAGLLVITACGDDLIEPEQASASASSGSATAGPTTTGEADSTGVGSGSGTVDESGSSSGEPFVGCGDGLVAEGEQCDDGNMIDGDGCSAACERSGEVLGELRWPDGLDAAGNGIARAPGGGFVVVGLRDVADRGTSAAVLGLGDDLSVTWAQEVQGGSPEDRVVAYAVTVTDDGSIWAVGRSLREDEMALDVEEPWVARFDADGTLQFSEVFPEPGVSYRGVAALPGGDAVVVGWEELEDGTYRALARRHGAAAGVEAWTDRAADADPESVALSVVVTPEQEVVVGGWIRGFAQHRDLRLQRYTADGAEIDVTLFAEPLTSYFAREMRVLEGGDVVLCGSVVRASANTAMLGRFTLGQAAPAVWLQRIEAVGQGATSCEGLDVDAEGRVAFTGYAFSGESAFDPLVGRLSADGELLWSGRVVPTEGYLGDFGNGMVLDDAGDLVVTGQVQTEGDGRALWVSRVRG